MKYRSWPRQLAALLVAVLFALPLYWAGIAALRGTGLPPATSVEWWPREVHPENFVQIFRVVPLARYGLNSLLVVATAVPLTLLTASWAGLAMALLPDRARRQLLTFSLTMLVVPAAAVWIFRFQVLQALGLVDTLWALVVPAVGASSPLFVLLFYAAFRRLPPELWEAARLEGAGALRLWVDIALPLTQPTGAAVTLLAFVLYWSDFVGPVLYLYSPDRYTLAVGLQLLHQLDASNWPLLMAAAVGMTLPVIALFALLQPFFLRETAE